MHTLALSILLMSFSIKCLYSYSAQNAWQSLVAYDACFRLCLNAWTRGCMEAPEFLRDECLLLRNAFGYIRLGTMFGSYAFYVIFLPILYVLLFHHFTICIICCVIDYTPYCCNLEVHNQQEKVVPTLQKQHAPQK